MIIKPRTRGFICTTTHPSGCEANVLAQIASTRAKGSIDDGPKKVLVVGASTGFGLASRIAAAFGCGAATLGVFLEREGTDKKPGSPGWYNSWAFEKAAHAEGLYAKSIQGDAFSNEVREKTVELIKADLGQVDLVVYSLASPLRKLPGSGDVVRSAIKPIGAPFSSTSIDTSKDRVVEAEIAPASEEEIANTITVMGGEDWELWIQALIDGGVLAEGAATVAYSYIGTDVTAPIYSAGTLGRAKLDMDRAATALRERLASVKGNAYVAVLKSVVTQASAAIPVMPLYISLVAKVMKEHACQESVIEHIDRMFRVALYGEKQPTIDENQRIRMDAWELRDDVQNAVRELWPQVTTDNLFELTDYQTYKDEFLQLFGFGVAGIDYEVDVDPAVDFHPLVVG